MIGNHGEPFLLLLGSDYIRRMRQPPFLDNETITI
jgi:hypothetical protein